MILHVYLEDDLGVIVCLCSHHCLQETSIVYICVLKGNRNIRSGKWQPGECYYSPPMNNGT